MKARGRVPVRVSDFAWPRRIEVFVPWADLDAAGHVNNARYFSYMETCRAEAWLALRGGDDVAALDIILARATCDYRSAANFRETLVVECWPTRVGETSFSLAYRISAKGDGRLVAEGESVQVCFDYKANRKKAIPDDARKALEAGLAEARNL